MLKKIMNAVLLSAFVLVAGCQHVSHEVVSFRAGKTMLFQAKDVQTVVSQPVVIKRLDGAREGCAPFEERLQLWAVSTFAPTGEEGVLFITFEDAEVQEVPLKPQRDNLFYRDPNIRYDAKISVRLEHHKADGTVEGGAFAQAQRAVSMRDDATLAEKDRRLKQLWEDVIADLDVQIRAAVQDGMFNSLQS